MRVADDSSDDNRDDSCMLNYTDKTALSDLSCLFRRFAWVLAVWGSGVRVPLAPLISAGQSAIAIGCRRFSNDNDDSLDDNAGVNTMTIRPTLNESSMRSSA